MKTLSIIIVNYNVVHFLEQCLLSVITACEGIEAEVIVVDNNSVDGSTAMLKEKFPSVRLLANTENVGFSRANNQGITQSSGKYVLLLNPDTVVEADTFRKCITFMEEHPDAGACGVYMVNGKGEFLPESKRSLPTPLVAFYKVFGLSGLFPRSAKFGKYHLGYLNRDRVHEVEVLSGAFMMLRKEALDKTGLLDETFFMYGEDIDLSYRILKAGYRNYYFPGTRIIHYKGESTRKSSLNYVFVFYQAMIIFAKKHFTGNNARVVSLLIHLAIYFRAALAIARRGVMKLLYPLLDISFLWGGIFLMKQSWAENVRFGTGGDYPPEFMIYVVPAYILVWMLSMYFSGAYDKPVSVFKVFRGMSIGTLVILVVYALLPETLRYSRAMIIFGFFYASAILPAYRYLLSFTGIVSFSTGSQKQKRFAVIGNMQEAERVVSILQQTNPGNAFTGIITIDQKRAGSGYLGHLGQLNEILLIYQINELVFCLKDLAAKEIIDIMTQESTRNIQYRIAPPESMYLVGSGTIHTTSDLYIYSLNSIASPANKRNKRVLDLIASLLLLILSPLILPWQRKPSGYLVNCIRVLVGRCSWVGYQFPETRPGTDTLPALRNGILKPADGINTVVDDDETIHRLNLIYARDYHIKNDLSILLNNLRNLGK
jgi:O-antigen biosynthesis protein